MYTQPERNLIWLDSLNLIHKKRDAVLSLLEKTGEESFLFAYKKVLPQINGVLTAKEQEEINKTLNEDYLNRFIDAHDNLGIEIITKISPKFPQLLNSIEDAPLVLYLKGNANVLSNKCIAIVGTRRPTRYGREMCEHFATKLGEAGLTTVSGLAFGIDTAVAQTAVNFKAQTIAVLAGGLDNIYPAQNYNLAEDIIKNGGAIISEYPIKVRPQAYSFLERNRIISGLSLGTIVIEAGEKSGALKTATDAVEQNRELFVLPGNINSYASVGCNNLIRKLPDCFTISPEDVLSRLHLDSFSAATKHAALQLTMEENLILSALEGEELNLDDLCEATQISSKDLISMLSNLEIKGIIKRLPGNYFAKISLPN